MSRYNKIFAGPFTEAIPQVVEARAAVAGILPGTFVVFNGDGNLQPANADILVGQPFVVQDNYLLMKGVNDAYAQGEVVLAMRMIDPQFFNVRIAPAVSLARGQCIGLGANGRAIPAPFDFNGLIIGYAEEEFVNSTAEDQLVRIRATTVFLAT